MWRLDPGTLLMAAAAAGVTKAQTEAMAVAEVVGFITTHLHFN